MFIFGALVGMAAARSGRMQPNTASRPEPIVEDVFHRPQLNDMYYSPEHLEAMAAQGVDVSDFHGDHSSLRGIQDSQKWSQQDSDGLLVIAWSVAAGYPYESEITDWMEQFGSDLEPCMKTIKVERQDLSTTDWTNGILFGWENSATSGCWSWVGLAPGAGLSWGNSAVLTDNNAPSTWQYIHMSAGCGGNTAATVHHETLHALGTF